MPGTSTNIPHAENYVSIHKPTSRQQFVKHIPRRLDLYSDKHAKYSAYTGHIWPRKIHHATTLPYFYIMLTVHLDVILVNDQLDALFLDVFISCLYMFRATSAHHQEDQVVLIHHLV